MKTPVPAPPKEPRIVRFHLSGDGDVCDKCGWKMPGYYYVHARTDGHLFCSLECSNASPPKALNAQPEESKP